MRNTVYQINKTLKGDYIISPNKVLLVLNKDLLITSDIARFNKNPLDYLAEYVDEFLKGFYLKGCEEYEFWINKMRNYYEKTFIKGSVDKLKQDMANNNFENVEKNIYRLIDINEFDETNYQLLMEYYQISKQDSQVISTYYSLADLLKRELNIEPSEATKKIYQSSLEKISTKNSTSVNRFSGYFYGRQTEILELEVAVQRFFNQKKASSVLIKGDTGIGKTALVQRFLDNIQNHFFIVEWTCYEVDQIAKLVPWRNIIEQLSEIIKRNHLTKPSGWEQIIQQIFPTFKDEKSATYFLEQYSATKLIQLSDILIEGIKQISTYRPLLLVIDEAQWLDPFSSELLLRVMLHGVGVFGIFISDKEANSAFASTMSALSANKQQVTIDLPPLTLTEVEQYAKKQLPGHALSTETVQDLYCQTQGNLFFIKESLLLLNKRAKLEGFTKEMQTALAQRLVALSLSQKALVELAVYFPHEVSLTLLSKLLNQSILEIVQTIDSLEQKNILTEQQITDYILFEFVHPKLKAYIYEQQSPAKRKATHEAIAELLVEHMDSDFSNAELYHQIAYHYTKAHNELQSLNYELLYLQSYLGFYHELFPVYSAERQINKNTISSDHHLILPAFKQLRKKLLELEPIQGSLPMYQQLLIKFLYLEGRYLIRCGRYHQGTEDIQLMLVKAKTNNESVLLLEGYKQMIYYCIQTDQVQSMLTYIEQALDIAIKNNNHESIGVLLRLKGLYYSLIGEFSSAETFLSESINNFQLTEQIAKKYATNIAAAYNYLGEIRHMKGCYDEALTMYFKAVELCEDKGAKDSLSVFYVNIGITYFAKEQIQDAKTYLLQADDFYEHLFSVWKRAQLDAYLSLVSFKLADGSESTCVAYLKRAEEHAEKMANARDQGVIHFVKSVIKHQLERTECSDSGVLNNYLSEPAQIYAEKATLYLNKKRDLFELETLNNYFNLST